MKTISLQIEKDKPNSLPYLYKVSYDVFSNMVKS